AGGAEKSKSGPIVAGHARLSGFFAWQPIAHASFGSTCRAHLMAPVSMFIAITASLIGCGGSAYWLPVATYTSLRFASMVGGDQMPTPAGPKTSLPSLFLPRGLGSGIVYVFQTILPVLVSSAVTLPRKVQHA